MNASPSLDELLAEVRADGARGAWRSAHERLGAHAARLGAEPAFALASAEASLRVGRPSEARHWADAAAGAPARALSAAARAQAANYAGAAALALGQLDLAEASFAEAVELGRAAGHDLHVARGLNNLAIVADIRGRREDALSLYESAIPVYQRLGQLVGLGETWHNMGLALRHLGRYDRADDCERRAAEYAREAEDARLEEMARVGRAEIRLLLGDYALAEAAAARAVGTLAALGHRALEADAIRLMATARMRRGDAARAREPLEQAVRLAREAEDRLILAECLLASATAALATGDRAIARAEAAEAVRLFEALSASDQLVEARALLGRS